MENQRTKILCICNCLLGNRTVTLVIKEALDSIKDIHSDYIFINPQDYIDYRVPQWKKLTGMTSELLYVVPQKTKNINLSNYDLVLIHGFEIGWALNNKVRDIPCIMLHDSTPILSHQLICKYIYSNRLAKIRSLILIGLYKIFFRDIFSNIDQFFPMINLCQQSLIKDYSIPVKKVAEGTVAIKPNKCEASKNKDNRAKIKLLFVGNDFKRKGGDFLFKVYSQVSDQCDLIIISNDKILDSMIFPSGVVHYKNISNEEILNYFSVADIFIFPTLKEHLGYVQLEAMASGLPILSRDIGGVSDLIKDGYNGYLMPYNSSVNEWVRKIDYLIKHPQERRRMGDNSLLLVREKYNIENFTKTIHHAIEHLVEG